MIKGKRINLRTVREKDLDALFEFSADIENRGDYYPLDLPSEASFKSRFREDGFWGERFGRLLIVGKEDDRILGTIYYFKSEPHFDALEIGYVLYDRESRNQGLMTEALSLLVRYLFDTKKVNRLQLGVIVGNEASRRVAEKCGFTSEGVARGALFHRGENVDLERFSILRGEADEREAE